MLSTIATPGGDSLGPLITTVSNHPSRRSSTWHEQAYYGQGPTLLKQDLHDVDQIPGGFATYPGSQHAPQYVDRQLPRAATHPLTDPDADWERINQYRHDVGPSSGRDRRAGYDPIGHPLDRDRRGEAPLARQPSPVQTNLGYKPPPGRLSPTSPVWGTESLYSMDQMDPGLQRGSSESKREGKAAQKPHHTQKRTNRDEFDGPTQLLKKPPTDVVTAHEQELPQVPINLDVREQDQVLSQVNIQLSQCAFDFVAKYQFPIPVEADKRLVEEAKDREWSEWVYLLKRLAIKRRIPARILYDGQIKQLVTVLENSLEMRHASANQSRPPKDDRNVLQLISAGTQVAKILKDARTMDYLDKLYQQVEGVIQERRQGSTMYTG